MTDLASVIGMIAWIVLFLRNSAIVTELKKFKNVEMINKVYLLFAIVGVILCLLCNVFELDLSLCFYCWIAGTIFLNLISMFSCHKFIGCMVIREVVFGVLSILLLIITIVLFWVCLKTSEKDLTGLLLLVVGNSMIAFSFLVSSHCNYGLN